MPNITISLNENLLKEGRRYARVHNLSINGLIRKLLERIVESSTKEWQDECFQLMDQANGNSQGMHWKREDLYNVLDQIRFRALPRNGFQASY